MKKISITVNEGLSNYLYLLSVNIESRKTLLDTFAPKMGLDDPTVKAYMDEYYIYDAKYKMVQNNISAALTSSDSNIIEWSVEFATSVMTITVPDDYKLTDDTIKAVAAGFPNSNLGIDEDIVAKLDKLYNNPHFTDEHGIVDEDCSCGSCNCSK